MKKTTPEKMKAVRIRAKMSQDAISEKFDLSVRFWRDRELGKERIPYWLHYAVIGFIHEHFKKTKK